MDPVAKRKHIGIADCLVGEIGKPDANELTLLDIRALVEAK